MKLTKLKNKINTFKREIRHDSALNYADWLNSKGLEDNAENREIYGLYALSVDDSNKKADMRLSQFIGKVVFVAIFITVFLLACCNKIGATSIIYTDGVYDETEITNSYQYTQSCEFTWDGFDTSFDLIYIDFTNSSGYYYKIYIVENVEYYHERVDYFVQDKTQDNIFDFLYYYADNNPNSVDGYFGSEWYYGTPLLTLYYEYENLYDNIYDEGFDEGYDIGDDEGYDIGYDEGYDIGYDDGIADGYTDGFDIGYGEGTSDGYTEGYTAGINDGEIAKKSIFAIFDAPIKVLTSLLDFEIFGINLLAIFKVVLTIIILGAIAKFVLSIAL